MNPYKDKILAFVDTETSGLDCRQHEIIEIGVILYDRRKDLTIEEWQTRIAPRNISTASKEALDINGYNKDPDSYKTNIESALCKLNKLTSKCIIVGQNISFDLGFIRRYMEEFNIAPEFDRRSLDIMSMAWPYASENNLNGLSLKDLCNHFNFSNVGSHSALTDCRRALNIYKTLISIYNQGKKNV